MQIVIMLMFIVRKSIQGGFYLNSSARPAHAFGRSSSYLGTTFIPLSKLLILLLIKLEARERNHRPAFGLLVRHMLPESLRISQCVIDCW